MDCFVAFAPRNDDGDGRRQCQNHQKRSELPKANACAAASASRSMYRRAGPGTIIRLLAGARMGRPTPLMSEAGASGFALPKARHGLRVSMTRSRKPPAAFAGAVARR